MAKVYPKSLRFLLADAIRQEAGGKLTLLGLYAGDEVVLQGELPDVVPDGMKGVAIQGLTVLIMIPDGHGEFQCRFQLFDPTGDLLIDGRAAVTVNKQKGIASNLLFPISPFPVPQFGRYRVLCDLDKRSFEYSFVIRHQDPNATLPGPNIPPEHKQPVRTSRKKAPAPPKVAASREPRKARPK